MHLACTFWGNLGCSWSSVADGNHHILADYTFETAIIHVIAFEENNKKSDFYSL